MADRAGTILQAKPAGENQLSAGLGGDISSFVPPNVERALRRKLKP